MDLYWEEHRLTDSEGDRFVVHYLIDRESARCYAIIPEPRNGHILYQTDLKLGGYDDRSYTSLEASKDYCEYIANLCALNDDRDLVKSLHPEPKPEEAVVGGETSRVAPPISRQPE